MKSPICVALLLSAVLLTGPAGGVASATPVATPVQQADDEVAIRTLLGSIEAALQHGDPDAYLHLVAGDADRKGAEEFAAAEVRAGATRAVIQERDRQDLAGTLVGTGFSLSVDAFVEFGGRARVATWQLDIKRVDADHWVIAGQQRLSAVESLYRLALNAGHQFTARNFTVLAEDLELTLIDGSVFTVDTDQGVTGLVLLGRGAMRFHPSPKAEVEQVRVLAGTDAAESPFSAAFVRVGTFEAHADPSVLVPRAVDARELKRAEQVFHDESVKSFVIDLADLTRDTWSLLPGPDDFLAEIRTRRFGTLTYTRNNADPEDIAFFERRRHRTIASYASKARLAARGPFYNEDDLAPFDVIDYNVDVALQPDREWIDGRATLRLRVRAESLGQLTIRLADSLVVRSVVSDRFGRLFNLRVPGQNSVLVNLPVLLVQGADLTLKIEYGGRLEPQTPDRETLQIRDAGPLMSADDFEVRPEPSFLYSNRSYWYPQSTVTDYATASMRITIPAAYGCVASGQPASSSPEVIPADGTVPARKVYEFTADRPLRYLAIIVSRFNRADRWTVAFDRDDAGAPVAPSRFVPLVGATPVTGHDTTVDQAGRYTTLDLIVDANPQRTNRGRQLGERAVDVFQYYESVIGDSPYATFSLGVVEGLKPGGHSPAYFAELDEPIAETSATWRTDPAAFANYPEFFLAHEIAHQWWGQAVGWRNYHEQWLSEGFAQYFAALYAQHVRGHEVFAGVLRKMRQWAIDESDQGLVYLGYRVGHLRSDGRAFRAVIYNKGALVLHMLRGLLGDEAFFRGIRRFYTESRYRKVGTDDLRVAMEAESGRSLDRFFDRWIYDSTLPRIAFTYRVDQEASGAAVTLHFEQTGDLFDLPVTVLLQYADRRIVPVVVPVTDRVVDVRTPLHGTLRSAEISRDDGSLVEVTKGR